MNARSSSGIQWAEGSACSPQALVRRRRTGPRRTRPREVATRADHGSPGTSSLLSCASSKTPAVPAARGRHRDGTRRARERASCATRWCWLPPPSTATFALSLKPATVERGPRGATGAKQARRCRRWQRRGQWQRVTGRHAAGASRHRSSNRRARSDRHRRPRLRHRARYPATPARAGPAPRPSPRCPLQNHPHRGGPHQRCTTGPRWSGTDSGGVRSREWVEAALRLA